MAGYTNISLGDQLRAQEAAFRAQELKQRPPVLIMPAPRPTASAPPPPRAWTDAAPLPAPAPAASPCNGCKGHAPAAPAPAKPPSSSSSAPVGWAPAPAAAVVTRQDESGGIVKPRDPRELLQWIEDNGGMALWIILLLVVLSIWSKHGGGSQTWR